MYPANPRILGEALAKGFNDARANRSYYRPSATTFRVGETEAFARMLHGLTDMTLSVGRPLPSARKSASNVCERV